MFRRVSYSSGTWWLLNLNLLYHINRMFSSCPNLLRGEEFEGASLCTSVDICRLTRGYIDVMILAGDSDAATLLGT